MKTLKVFFAMMLIVFLAVGISSAQENKTVTTYSWDYVGLLPCTDDVVTGVETLVETVWDGKKQWIYKGNYTGESGKLYTWSLVVNRNAKNYTEDTAYNRTYVSTSVIECEGVPIAIYKIRYHFTYSANGDLTVEFYRDSGADWICL